MNSSKRMILASFLFTLFLVFCFYAQAQLPPEPCDVNNPNCLTPTDPNNPNTQTPSEPCDPSDPTCQGLPPAPCVPGDVNCAAATCPSGQTRCSDNVCRPSCSSTSCPSGQTRCSDNICRTSCPAASCPSGQTRCSDGACRISCSSGGGGGGGTTSQGGGGGGSTTTTTPTSTTTPPASTTPSSTTPIGTSQPYVPPQTYTPPQVKQQVVVQKPKSTILGLPLWLFILLLLLGVLIASGIFYGINRAHKEHEEEVMHHEEFTPKLSDSGFAQGAMIPASFEIPAHLKPAKEFTDECRKRGFSEQEIYDELSYEGWEQEEIDEVMRM